MPKAMVATMTWILSWVHCSWMLSRSAGLSAA